MALRRAFACLVPLALAACTGGGPNPSSTTISDGGTTTGKRPADAGASDGAAPTEDASMSTGACDPAFDPLDCPNGTAQSTQVNLTYSWQLENLADAGPAATCSNTGAIVPYLVLYGPMNATDTTTLDCNVMSGTAQMPLTPGLWNASYELATNNGSFSADTVPFAAADVSFTWDGGAPNATIPLGVIEYAQFPLAFTISRGGVNASCADVGATTIELTLTHANLTQKMDLTCGTSPVLTGMFTNGNWTVVATLLDGQSNVLATWTDPTLYSVTTSPAGAFGPLVFDVDATDAGSPDAGADGG